MNYQQISNLLIKISGILIIVFTLSQIPHYLFLVSGYGENKLGIFLTSALLPSILPLVIGVFMFIKHEKITNQFVVEPEKLDHKTEIQCYRFIERISLSILGYYLLFISFSDILYNLSNILYSNASLKDFTGQIIPLSRIIIEPNFITSVFELAMSAILILRTNTVVNFAEKLRNK
ncbi:MAG: hypothetical protein OCC45_10765 [Desulfotalea sp.]